MASIFSNNGPIVASDSSSKITEAEKVYSVL